MDPWEAWIHSIILSDPLNTGDKGERNPRSPIQKIKWTRAHSSSCKGKEAEQGSEVVESRVFTGLWLRWGRDWGLRRQHNYEGVRRFEVKMQVAEIVCALLWSIFPRILLTEGESTLERFEACSRWNGSNQPVPTSYHQELPFTDHLQST